MKIAICVTFYYRQNRLAYLAEVVQNHKKFPCEVHVIVLTNTENVDEIQNIVATMPSRSGQFYWEIISVSNIPHGWVLTWAHKDVFKNIIDDSTYTHFMYTEDDIAVTANNVAYWSLHRELLKPHGLYPSFIRVEWNQIMGAWTCSDVVQKIDLQTAPQLVIRDGMHHYVNAPQPYQGLYLYDRELMIEHRASRTFDFNSFGVFEPDYVGVPERANLALTFENVPDGFTSRNILNYSEKYKLLNYDSFVHHLPNTFADNPQAQGGKVPVLDLMR